MGRARITQQGKGKLTGIHFPSQVKRKFEACRSQPRMSPILALSELLQRSAREKKPIEGAI